MADKRAAKTTRAQRAVRNFPLRTARVDFGFIDPAQMVPPFKACQEFPPLKGEIMNVRKLDCPRFPALRVRPIARLRPFERLRGRRMNGWRNGFGATAGKRTNCGGRRIANSSPPLK